MRRNHSVTIVLLFVPHASTMNGPSAPQRVGKKPGGGSGHGFARLPKIAGPRRLPRRLARSLSSLRFDSWQTPATSDSRPPRQSKLTRRSARRQRRGGRHRIHAQRRGDGCDPGRDSCPGSASQRSPTAAWCEDRSLPGPRRPGPLHHGDRAAQPEGGRQSWW